MHPFLEINFITMLILFTFSWAIFPSSSFFVGRVFPKQMMTFSGEVHPIVENAAQKQLRNGIHMGGIQLPILVGGMKQS